MKSLYINIGTAKSCFFVKISFFLIKQLQIYPFLFHAVEESIVCAKEGYYATGIITFAQLLNLMKHKTPNSRHLVAHSILKVRPGKAEFIEVTTAFKEAASVCSNREMAHHKQVGEYQKRVLASWAQFVASRSNRST
jgi:hypothetical protein